MAAKIATDRKDIGTSVAAGVIQQIENVPEREEKASDENQSRAKTVLLSLCLVEP